MAYFGVQFRGDAQAPAQRLRCASSTRAFDADDGPGHWDRARYIDEAGFTNDRVASPTGTSPRASTPGSRRTAPRWTRRRAGPGLGTFTEVAAAGGRRATRRCSRRADRAEGIAVLADGMSDMVQRACLLGRRARPHPAVADRRDGAARARRRSWRDGALVTGACRTSNLCLIRSGQDWSDTERRRAAHVPRRRRAGAARRHGLPARRRP